MGLELVSKLVAHVQHLEQRLSRMEENIPAVYGSQSRGFYKVMGTLDGDISPGSSQTITLKHIDGTGHSPARTQTVWLLSNASAITSGTFVFAHNAYVGEKGKFVIDGKVCSV